MRWKKSSVALVQLDDVGALGVPPGLQHGWQTVDVGAGGQVGAGRVLGAGDNREEREHGREDADKTAP